MSRADPQAAIFFKAREMILLMNVHLNHFPRHEKYALCQEIRQAAYGVYGLLVECQKRYHNKTSLGRLARRLVAERPALLPYLPTAVRQSIEDCLHAR